MALTSERLVDGTFVHVHGVGGRGGRPTCHGWALVRAPGVSLEMIVFPLSPSIVHPLDAFVSSLPTFPGCGYDAVLSPMKATTFSRNGRCNDPPTLAAATRLHGNKGVYLCSERFGTTAPPRNASDTKQSKVCSKSTRRDFFLQDRRAPQLGRLCYGARTDVDLNLLLRSSTTAGFPCFGAGLALFLPAEDYFCDTLTRLPTKFPFVESVMYAGCARDARLVVHCIVYPHDGRRGGLSWAHLWRTSLGSSGLPRILPDLRDRNCTASDRQVSGIDGAPGCLEPRRVLPQLRSTPTGRNTPPRCYSYS